MSKLTGWIGDTDSLDIQGIVDKYEAELIEKKNSPASVSKKETTILDGQEIWSGSIDDLHSAKTKKAPLSESKIETPNINIEKQEPISFKEEVSKKDSKTRVLNFDIEEVKNSAPKADTRRPEVPKFEIPGSKPQPPKAPTINLNKIEEVKKVEEKIEPVQERQDTKTEASKFSIPNLFAEEAKTKPVESSKTINLFASQKTVKLETEKTQTYKDDMVKKQLNELAKAKAELEAANELVRKQLAEMQKAKEELEQKQVAENEAPKFFDNVKTINFDVDETTTTDDIKLVNPNTKVLDVPVKTNKTKTIKFVDEDASSEKEVEAFNNNVDYFKILEDNDVRTVKFQPTDSQLSRLAEEEGKVKPDENINSFTKRLTKIFFNETQKAEDLDLTRELDHSQGISVDSQPQVAQKKRKGLIGFFLKKKANNTIDKDKVPSFLKTEIKFAAIAKFVAAIFLLIGLFTLAFTTWEVYGNAQSVYYYIPAGIFAAITLIFFIDRQYRLKSLKKEILRNNYILDTDKPLMSLKRIYKRLVLANLNLNWFSAIMYVWSVFGVTGTYLVTYFMNLFMYGVNNFPLLEIQGNNLPTIIMWSFASISFFVLPIQIIMNFVNSRRKNNIDHFYGKEIITEELQIKYKKSAKWKWVIILIISLIIFTLPVVITYYVLKKKHKKIPLMV